MKLNRFEDRVVLSTPKSKMVERTSLPSTPSKRLKLDIEPFTTLSVSPSKMPRSHLSIIKANSKHITRQTLPFDSDATLNKNDIDDTRILEGSLSSKLNSDDRRQLLDMGTISPLSDISSISSLSPDIDKLESIDSSDLGTFIWNTKPLIQKETYELSKMIHSAILKSPLENLQIDGMELQSQSTTEKKSEPHHRESQPKKPILNIASAGLNLIVSSSKGSLQDATIFATEINASTNGHENKLPVISNIWERITIPVNSSIKEKHKRIKQDLYGLYDDELDIDSFELFEKDRKKDYNDTSTEDAALIRGFEYKLQSDCKLKNRSKIKQPKRVRWSTMLEL
ncbi:hypothetical protein KAFR_0D01620 [Kazachstania africana CBS 2517]|uniref:Uncharacterized protein n=1 Tax=Kazachstania africana (strain ATCC 22294 / BCRC 22015 / CBS 2517 / CECT 1963 / NBRC 1671 / NRRL Y-8276) TaxID=1071382 RepID=H2ATV8_KAZAF|nr:hypothetical protein KAFR_0D01620 [Kazachstania africana CBS 2517]CCF57808.1 hypothetical protein KAFR_0D01620 [Kazachstania africana CBS 2517]